MEEGKTILYSVAKNVSKHPLDKILPEIKNVECD